MWSRLSLRFKLTTLVVSVVVAASWVFGQFAYTGLAGLFDKVTGLRAVTVAEALAATVSPENLERWSSQAGADVQSELSLLSHRADALIRAGRIHRVELIRHVGVRQVEVVISYPDDGTDDYKPPGRILDVSGGAIYLDRESGYSGTDLAAGAYMAGWAPIGPKESPLGLFMVAIDVSETQAALDFSFLAIIFITFVVTVLSGLIAFKFATSFEKSAVTDGLMGIYNHKYLKQRLESEVAKAARYGQQTSLVLLDIDYFKRVNDTYGHATGDLVLKMLARWVTESVRNTDVAARYGGEEIAIVLPHTSLAGAQGFAERLRQKISEQVVHDREEDAQFRVTVSVGVAQWEKGMSMLDLIKRADAALYYSKNTGRNRVSIYQEDLLPDLALPQPAPKPGR